MASRNVETFRAAHQAFNRRDFDAVVNAMAQDVTYEDRARGVTFRGRTGFKDFMQGWVTAMSNAEVSEPTYIDAGDVVVAQFIGRGLNDGPLGPLPATGKHMNLPFCEVLRFNDKGQIVSGALYYDQLSLMMQLGHAQKPQSA
ncbi:MAG: ester cyclase [Acidobacteria bacterium]|nr:ester cyclase [Acidobacteriota bacterium]